MSVMPMQKRILCWMKGMEEVGLLLATDSQREQRAKRNRRSRKSVKESVSSGRGRG